MGLACVFHGNTVPILTSRCALERIFCLKKVWSPLESCSILKMNAPSEKIRGISMFHFLKGKNAGQTRAGYGDDAVTTCVALWAVSFRKFSCRICTSLWTADHGKIPWKSKSCNCFNHLHAAGLSRSSLSECRMNWTQKNKKLLKRGITGDEKLIT